MESKEEDSTYNSETEPRYIKNADGSFQIPLVANYQQTKYWLMNLIQLAISRNSISALEGWKKNFKSDLRNEHPEVVFKRYKEKFLGDRSEYYRYANLYDDFIDDFEDEEKENANVLQRLTERVHHMYLNSSHKVEPERLIARIYSIHYMLTWLNNWMVKYIPEFDLKTINNPTPPPVYSVPSIPVDIRKDMGGEQFLSAEDNNKERKIPKRRSATIARENRIREMVEQFMSLEGKTRFEAMECAATKEGVGLDTVERAVGLRKR